MSGIRRKRSPLRIAAKALRELSRGVRIARDGGAGAGWIFLREEVFRNSWTRVFGGSARVECNVCGWKGPRFLTHCGAGYVNYDAFCPKCVCYPRHRGFAELLGPGSGVHLGREIEALRARGGRRLLFAPEPGMKMLLSRHVSGLEGIDIRRINELVVYVEDIQKLSFPDGSVDFFSCFHVVEHVPDDRAALRELARVLHPDGLAVFNVPMTFGRRETIAFGRAHPLANGHWFDFGEDFVERLVEAGLSGKGYRLRDVLTAERYEKLRLQDEMIFLLRRTAPGGIAVIQ